MLPIEKQKELRETDYFDSRNVADEFKTVPTEEVKSILSARSSDLIVIASNEIKDFNWGSVVRSVNSFNADRIIFTGRRSYNRRGAVGANNYTKIEYWEQGVLDLFASLRKLGYTIVAAEYDARYVMTALPHFPWPVKSAVIFGEEGRSLPQEILNDVDEIVYIPMHGSVRSLNLASAATTFLYDYNVKTGK
ncbi:hypothetical protein FDI69_gp033 [Rhodococcus phage Trina]|uniref:tRNA-methyltransferase n=1 Tax=Rhodococcus phage Trina TaxID=2027905 RepID=A0A2D1A6G0_9CAUD|nr:hypothetical protein FDI69_gp033 [Rhodococcus phage Trina]ASZ74850.1 tRNA-methyltransferase [Rhodococcus phage Trina]